MVYTKYFEYINGLTQSYITSNVVIVAKAIEPAVVALLSLYLILWGISCLRGEAREPITEAATRFVKIALICSLALQLGHYNELLVDTFVNGPEDLARMLTGASDASTTAASMDSIFAAGFFVANGFYEKGGLLSGDLGMYIVAFLVLGVTLGVTLYSFVLILISKIMLCVLLALGPIFIVSLLFQASAGYFNSWIHKMANYALVTILVVAMNKLIITLFQRATVGATSATQLDQAIPMIITGSIAIIGLAQLTSVAAGLAGGLSMSTQGIGSMGLSLMSSATGKGASMTGRAASAAGHGIKKGVEMGVDRLRKKAPREPLQIPNGGDNHIGPA